MHKAQITAIVKTRANIHRRFAVNIDIDEREVIALPAILSRRGIATAPRAKHGKQMHIIAAVFSPDAYRALVFSKSTGGKGRK
ncbi:Uncharacterised protein [Shigella sonnei]|nr:Uncharacterised protein [Shigella sonnei]CSG43593.1 Uncharacterised protein [Shigella sonnei]CSH41007.1 Uncharacterised protein [Shigella sonnei]